MLKKSAPHCNLRTMAILHKSDYATLYIVRHGQSHANVNKIISGHFDSPLTELGEAQAQTLGEKLRDIHFDAVFSSDLVRAKRTAELAQLERKLVVQTTTLLRERSFGSYEGKSHALFDEENKELLEMRKLLSKEEREKVAFGGTGESGTQLIGRLLLFLREVSVAYPGKTILIVTHGGMLQALLVHLGWSTYEGLPMRGIQNTSYIMCACDGVNFILEDTYGIEKQTV